VLPSKAKWEIRECDAALADRIAHTLSIDPLLAKLLVVRGIRDAEHARLFLHGSREHFHDPYLLSGMREAVERIRQAIQRKEKIRIYGDYDADGVSSTTLMILLFRKLGANFDYYIPHRVHEGYGLNKKAMELAKEQGVSLIVTVDTGISAREEIDYANSLGLDVVVTDHHEPPELLPQACAVINPKQPGCAYPFKQLAGVGVALKLAHALLERLPEEWLEIAAIGTVADLMPLIDENRLIVKFGLNQMRQTSNFGIQALLEVAGVSPASVTAGHIAFSLAPRINASGRLEAADAAVRLLISTDAAEAGLLARELDQLNRERQRLVDEMTQQATNIVEERRQSTGALPRVLVVAQEDWNAGVIGIVASKLLDKYYRPTVVLTIDRDSGVAKGSARSIEGFDIYRALSECSSLFTHYGGHQLAAGMSLPSEHIAGLEEKLNELAGLWLADDQFIPVMRADLECRMSDVSVSLIDQLELLAPYGMGNPPPKFLFTGLQLAEKRMLGKEKQHLKLALNEIPDPSAVPLRVDAIGFGQGHLTERISPLAKIDVLGELSVNEWNGTKKAQIIIRDLRVPHVQVFDWRGSKPPNRRVYDWLKWLESQETGASEGKRAVVVGSRRHYEDVRAFLPDDVPVWRMTEPEGMEPLNDAAGRIPFGEAEDVVLYSLPGHLAALRAVIAQGLRVKRWYALFDDDEETSYKGVGLPTREMFKTVYAAMRRAGGRPVPQRAFLAGISKRSGFSPTMVQFMLEVFEELAFIERVGGDYRLVSAPARKDLASSAKYRSLSNRQQVEQVLVYSSSRELSAWILSHTKDARFQVRKTCGGHENAL